MFKPIDFTVDCQIVQGVTIGLRCLNGKHVDIRVRSTGGFTSWLMGVPFEDFCQGIRLLKANCDFEVHTLRCPFCAEWTQFGGLTLAHGSGQIDVSCSRSEAANFLEFCEDFISEVRDAQAA